MPLRQNGFHIHISSQGPHHASPQPLTTTGSLLASPPSVAHSPCIAPRSASDAKAFQARQGVSSHDKFEDTTGAISGLALISRQGSADHHLESRVHGTAAPKDIFSPNASDVTESTDYVQSPTSSSNQGEPLSTKCHGEGTVTSGLQSPRRYSIDAEDGSTMVHVSSAFRWFDDNTSVGTHGTGVEHIQPSALHYRTSLASSAPASSLTFSKGRAPTIRQRSDSVALPSSLSDVGEEDDLRQSFEGRLNVTDKRRKRRESHNLVERRRRDNINQAISDLSHLIPSVFLEPSPGASSLTHHHIHGATATFASSPTFNVEEFGSPGSGSILKPNKGLILERSVDYIKLLQQQVATLTAHCASLKDAVHGLDGRVSPFGTAFGQHHYPAADEASNGIDASVIDVDAALKYRLKAGGDFMDV